MLNIDNGFLNVMTTCYPQKLRYSKHMRNDEVETCNNSHQISELFSDIEEVEIISKCLNTPSTSLSYRCAPDYRPHFSSSQGPSQISNMPEKRNR